MRSRRKRPPGLVERKTPRPRGLHRSWLGPGWEWVFDTASPEADTRGNPVWAEVQTMWAVIGLPFDLQKRHWRLVKLLCPRHDLERSVPGAPRSATAHPRGAATGPHHGDIKKSPSRGRESSQ